MRIDHVEENTSIRVVQVNVGFVFGRVRQQDILFMRFGTLFVPC